MHVLTAVDPEAIKALRARDEFFWIDLVSPDNATIDQLGELLELHPLALEDTREFGQRPKLDPYGHHLLLVFYTARATGDPQWPAEPLELHVYLSGGFMVTVRRDECMAVDDLHKTLATEGTEQEERIVYLLLDTLTDSYYPVIEALEARVDALEEAVLQRPRRAQLTTGYRLKQCVQQLFRLVSAQKDQFTAAREAIVGLEGLTTGSRPYLRDIGDHLMQIAGEFHRQLEDLNSLTQTYFNANSDRLNAVAARITVVGSIFVLWTVVTGFFGQNFGWLVNHIASKHAFVFYGVGALVTPTVIMLTLFWVKRHDWF
jgi:magnesium transporter